MRFLICLGTVSRICFKDGIVAAAPGANLVSFWSISHEVRISNQHSAKLEAGREQRKLVLWTSLGEKRPKTSASHAPRAQVVPSLTLTLPLTLTLREPQFLAALAAHMAVSQKYQTGPSPCQLWDKRARCPLSGRELPYPWRKKSALSVVWWEVCYRCRSLVLFGAEVLGFRFKFAAEKPFLSPKELSRRVRRSPTGS